MKPNAGILLGLILFLMMTGSAFAETIELVTYYPASATTGQVDTNRLHANRATIGAPPYSTTNPADADLPNGTLLVAGPVGIGTAAPAESALLDMSSTTRGRGALGATAGHPTGGANNTNGPEGGSSSATFNITGESPNSYPHILIKGGDGANGGAGGSPWLWPYTSPTTIILHNGDAPGGGGSGLYYEAGRTNSGTNNGAQGRVVITYS